MVGQKKKKTATVVSNKMDKTVVVTTYRLTKHALYKKYMKKRVKFKAHDENNISQVGDTVLVQESRPLSKEKRWEVLEVVKKAI